MTDLKAIVFDAYGTLFDISSIDRRLAGYFGEQAPQVAALWRRKQLEYTWLHTLMNRYRPFSELTADALQYTCQTLGLPIDPVLIEELMDQYQRLTVFPDVPEALHRLSRRFSVNILSNADPDLLAQAVAFNEIGSWVQEIFSVEALGKFKPSPEVYQLPATHKGLESKAILFVSSNSWDVAGAGSAGLQVAWIQRVPQVMDPLGYTPGLVLRDLAELANALEE